MVTCTHHGIILVQYYGKNNKMAQEKIDYKIVIDLGFEREDQTDSIFYDQYGFNWFIVTKKLTKRTYLDWDCNTRIVTLKRIDKNHNIVGSLDIESLEELKNIIDFFTNKK